MWHLKISTNELICKTETDLLHIENNLMVTKGEREESRDKLGVWGSTDLNFHT